MGEILSGVIDIVFDLLMLTSSWLFDSPIQVYLDSVVDGDGKVVEVMHYVNYFLPINKMVYLTEVWVGVIAMLFVYYVVKDIYSKK